MTTIHLVTHTHWDREWYLTFQQFRFKLVHLVDHLLDTLDNDPLYASFLLDGQAILLEDYLEIRHEREPDLVQHIKSGRLFIGPLYISPDEFLISPETHIRNLLEGDRICRHFGPKMLVGYLPDTFGHIGQMPQILAGFGIDQACVWRGLDDQPCELAWKAPDGSQVLLAFLRESYSNAAGLSPSDPDKFTRNIGELASSLQLHSQTGRVLLMAGTDHMEPSKDIPAATGYYRSQPNLPELIHSSLPGYFDSVRMDLANSQSQLPEVIGELRSSKRSPLLPNVLSTRIWIKQRSHSCEIELLKWVEPFIAMANVINSSASVSINRESHHPAGITRPEAMIRYAWKLLLQCHPHDSICGTSIDQVANEMRTRFDQVDQLSCQLLNQSLNLICAQVDTSLASHPALNIDGHHIVSAILIFNPNNMPQTGLIDLNIELEDHYSSFDIVDEQGNLIPFNQAGTGARSLISVSFDRAALRQGFHMVNEGRVAGFIIRDFHFEKQDHRALIRATISDHGEVDLRKWQEGVAEMDKYIADPDVDEFFVQAYSDPEIQLSLVAGDVPAHGYRTYWIRGIPEKVGTTPTPSKLNPLVRWLLPMMGAITKLPILSRPFISKKNRAARETHKIENEFFIVEPHSGTNSLSVIDKRTGQIYTGLNRFVDTADRGDLYNYCPLENDTPREAYIKKVDVEHCLAYQRLVIYYDLRLPSQLTSDRKSRSHDQSVDTITSTITLIPGLPRIDIHTEVDNHAHDHRLRVHFPAPFPTAQAFYDGHFEIVRRPIGVPRYDASWEEVPRPEVPQQQFTSICSDRLSMTIANQGIPEVEVLQNENGNAEIALTLLRCIGWLSRDDLSTRKNHAGPMGVPTPEAQMSGKYAFDYAILPGDGQWMTSIPLAYAFNAPLKSFYIPPHSGSLPSSCSLIESLNPSFVITAIKQSEDGKGIIVRGFNNRANPIDVDLRVFIPLKHVQLVNLAEELIEDLPVKSQNEISIHLAGNKIVTLLLQFE